MSVLEPVWSCLLLPDMWVCKLCTIVWYATYEGFPISEQGYIMEKLLYGMECQVLLDTGASKWFMSKSHYLHCKLCYVRQCSILCIFALVFFICKLSMGFALYFAICTELT